MAKSDNHLDLRIVVSGVEQQVRINNRESLGHAVREALRLSGNAGQPPEDWELRTEAGILLALDVRAEESGLSDGQILFLSPRAGAGG
ncbi:DUF2604 domain-containing protein [Micromonospora sp. NPDC048930]|uniref:DUF2604 domain-containing protein n=1 Tax=Micromonospora sp. NPDC048930 TaxID=3364261 RepID=UPI0037140BEF